MSSSFLPSLSYRELPERGARITALSIDLANLGWANKQSLLHQMRWWALCAVLECCAALCCLKMCSAPYSIMLQLPTRAKMYCSTQWIVLLCTTVLYCMLCCAVLCCAAQYKAILPARAELESWRRTQRSDHAKNGY